jgi:putative transposase
LWSFLIALPFRAGIGFALLSLGFSLIISILIKKEVPYIRVWIHYVWSTKNRLPVLADEFRYPLFEHIKKNALLKKIYLDRINGYHDHVHCLVSLGLDQTIEKIAQLIKGESSFWYNNKSGFNSLKLEWQNEYFAVSVGESLLDTVRAYIDKQAEHHQKKTFAEEYSEFIFKYGFKQFG